MVRKGDRHANGISKLSNSRRPQQDSEVPARTLALVRSPLALRCSKSKRAWHAFDPPASSYAIMRRACPYRGESSMIPARMCLEKVLTAGPELENSQVHLQPKPTVRATSAYPPRSGSTADIAVGPVRAKTEIGQLVGVCSGTIPSKNDTERSGARLIASHLYFKRTDTPPTAADTTAPTFGPLSCKIMPLAFCN